MLTDAIDFESSESIFIEFYFSRELLDEQKCWLKEFDNIYPFIHFNIFYLSTHKGKEGS